MKQKGQQLTLFEVPSTAASPMRQHSWKTFAREVVSETLYPTRCAICDAPGAPLCPTCTKKLPYIDTLSACPKCGAPFSSVQCSECNPVSLLPFGYSTLPYTEGVSALILSEEVHRIVITYKDQGERRLSMTMATIMARYIPPSWLNPKPLVTYIPATPAARRRRGFDHAEFLARDLSFHLGCDLAPVLLQPRRKDQRKLARMGRIENMRSALSVIPGASLPRDLILVDDVCTTGATLFAGTEALLAAGANNIRCATFARA